jgi:hypothetical protein
MNLHHVPSLFNHLYLHIYIVYIYTLFTTPTDVRCTRSFHSMLILLCGRSTILPPYLPRLRVYHWVLTHLWVCSRFPSEYEHFYFPSPAFGLYFFLPASCANISVFYLTHLWVVFHHSLVNPVYVSLSPLDVHILIISYSLEAVLALPILVPFGLLFNNVTLGFTYHLSYLHTYIQQINSDCRRVTLFTKHWKKVASALTYGMLPRRLQVYLPLAHPRFTTLSHDYVLSLFSSLDIIHWGFYFNIITITSWMIFVGLTYLRESSS